MTGIDHRALERAVLRLAATATGPGGAAGVVADGETLLAQAWGFADLGARLPMTERLRLPICSISKEFTCGVLLDVAGDPAALDGEVAGLLPRLEGRVPSVRELCNNQSGLRDYWALTVLHGAEPEGRFGPEDARPLFARMRSTQFAPGTRYSYSNGNFRILADLIEARAGRSLGELHAERIFGPAGMETAIHTPDTTEPADGVTGYEGNAEIGYFPARNRIYWTGDAGISASLEDMLAWERHIHATAGAANSLYGRLSAPQTFSDGAPARYGFGLAHEEIGGLAATGHGGALRGFRLQRLYVPAARLSVVVMFNHEADAHAAAVGLVRAALGQAEPGQGAAPGEGWSGWYLDRETELLLRVEGQGDRLVARFGMGPEELMPGPDGVARGAEMALSRSGDGLRVERPGENLRTEAVRVGGEAREDIAGRYGSDEIGGSLEIVSAGGALYGGFEGMLGRGGMLPLLPVGEDVWRMPCRRSMDAPAPGDWTLRVRRGEDGRVSGLGVGCWLARGVAYSRAG